MVKGNILFPQAACDLYLRSGLPLNLQSLLGKKRFQQPSRLADCIAFKYIYMYMKVS